MVKSNPLESELIQILLRLVSVKDVVTYQMWEPRNLSRRELEVLEELVMEESIIDVSTEGKVHSLSEVHDQVNWNQGGTRRQQASQQDETASDDGTHVVESAKEEGPPSAELIHFVGIASRGVI